MNTFKIKNIASTFAILIPLVLIYFISCSPAPNSPKYKPPNLVLILADDLGYGDLGCYGHQIIKTPNIDRLAESGVSFTQYYAAPAPLCSPSRASMLTGRNSYRTGIRSWIPPSSNIHLGKNEITIAHLLQEKGYKTAVMGKLHLNGGAEMKDHPQAKNMGFDHSFVIPGGWAKTKKVETKKEDGSLRQGPIYPDNFWLNGKAVGETDKFSGELVSNEVIEWLDQHDSSDPFFLYVPFSEVHTPIASPKRYLDMYSEYISDFAKANPYIYHWDWVNQPYRGQGEYYANVSFLDYQVGIIMDKLTAMNELDNTIIIFTSDNGPVTREARKPWELNMAGETGGLRGRKDNLLEGGIRVPAIVRYPKEIEPGRVSDVPITGMDWLPTLAEIMDFQVPTDREIDGQSVVKSFDGATINRKKPLIWTIDMKGQDDPINEWAIRDGDWKMIIDSEEKPKFLFNISTDPYEVINLIDENKNIQSTLFTKFLDYQYSIETDSVNMQ